MALRIAPKIARAFEPSVACKIKVASKEKHRDKVTKRSTESTCFPSCNPVKLGESPNSEKEKEMADENPFEQENNEAFDAIEDDGDVEQVQEESVADPSGDDDVEELPNTTDSTSTSTAPAKPKNTKPPVPEGYITPVQFAHKLTERERKAGRIGAGDSVPPQMIYSYVNQGKRPGANPETSLKSYTDGGRENLLKESEAFAYWDAKAQRAADREAAKKAKNEAAALAAQKAAETPAQSQTEASQGEVTEVE